MSCFDFTLPRLTKLRCIEFWGTRRKAGTTNSSHRVEVVAVHRDLLKRQTQQIPPLIKQRSGKPTGISCRWHQILHHKYSHLLMWLQESPHPSLTLSLDPSQSPRATPKASSFFWGCVSARCKHRLLWLIPTAGHTLRLTAPAEHPHTPSLSPVCGLHCSAHV